MIDKDAGGDSAFGFSGHWREYAPIAFTNLLLQVVTLGIYTFWARARTRRYLWSRTRFIDDRLEWTGTGTELFVGYLLAVVLFFIPVGVLNLIVQGVLLHGHPGAAILIGLLLYLGLIYLIGVAVFRALRYRLSRTFWHGIRGGSDENGFAYGWSYWWRTVVGFFAGGLLVPWSMTTLWNRRWRAMSFGQLRFEARADWTKLILRYLLFYLTPFVFVVVVIVLFVMLGGFAMMSSRTAGAPSPGLFAGLAIAAVLAYLLFFVILGLVALAYYAAFFREGVGTLSLGELRFGFTARTVDWVKLTLGNLGLTLVTLGVGYLFVPYRNWAFFVRHAQAYGEVRLDQLTQSATRTPGQGEGLLDALDVGAF